MTEIIGRHQEEEISPKAIKAKQLPLVGSKANFLDRLAVNPQDPHPLVSKCCEHRGIKPRHDALTSLTKLIFNAKPSSAVSPESKLFSPLRTDLSSAKIPSFFVLSMEATQSVGGRLELAPLGSPSIVERNGYMLET